MNINELLTMEQNVIISVTSKDLIEFAETIVSRTINKVQEHPKEDVFLSVGETMERLNVCRSTLWSWNNSGYLPTYKVGKSIRYKLADIIKIENAL